MFIKNLLVWVKNNTTAPFKPPLTLAGADYSVVIPAKQVSAETREKLAPSRIIKK
jgi:hypothetical protein